VFWSAFLAQKLLEEEAAAALAMDAADAEEQLGLDDGGHSLNALKPSSVYSATPEPAQRSGGASRMTKEEEADAKWEATRIKLEDLELIADISDNEDNEDPAAATADVEIVSDDGDEEYEDIDEEEEEEEEEDQDQDDDDDDEEEQDGFGKPVTETRRKALSFVGSVDIISRSDLFALFLALSPPVDCKAPFFLVCLHSKIKNNILLQSKRTEHAEEPASVLLAIPMSASRRQSTCSAARNVLLWPLPPEKPSTSKPSMSARTSSCATAPVSSSPTLLPPRQIWFATASSLSISSATALLPLASSVTASPSAFWSSFMVSTFVLCILFIYL